MEEENEYTAKYRHTLVTYQILFKMCVHSDRIFTTRLSAFGLLIETQLHDNCGAYFMNMLTTQSWTWVHFS